MTHRALECPLCHGAGKVIARDVELSSNATNPPAVILYPHGYCLSCGTPLPPPSSAGHVCVPHKVQP